MVFNFILKSQKKGLKIVRKFFELKINEKKKINTYSFNIKWMGCTK